MIGDNISVRSSLKTVIERLDVRNNAQKYHDTATTNTCLYNGNSTGASVRVSCLVDGKCGREDNVYRMSIKRQAGVSH